MEKIVIGNLKMNILSAVECQQYAESFKNAIKSKDFLDLKLVLCPPFVYIEQLAKKLSSKNVSIGAQDIFWEEKGSFTGEISPKMLKNLGAEYVIVGHSERRRYFGETSEMSNKKIQAAVKVNIAPVYCVGETEAERAEGKTAEIIVEQISEGLAGISNTAATKIIIAYEPVWAVGSDKIPSGDEILEAKIIVKKILIEMFGVEAAEKIKIVYGGSVKSDIAKQVCLDPGMDGVLVGRESLIPNELIKIAEIIK
jgi:triosephosphate isomerase